VEAGAKGGYGLIINEAHALMEGTGGFRKCSGMWMDEQIAGQARVAAAAIKKVCVVGGGIAGMEAACAAARRGHCVILFEKSDKLGGQWNYASMAPNKQELSTLTVWLKHQLVKLGVDIRLNSEAAVAAIKAEKADAVIIATGAIPVKAKIKGVESKNVCSFADVLAVSALWDQK
jgi:NADPH-dependent 2,4-dienoyl-CoA reductase/sulfur reductase-like enzyme